MLKNGRFRVLRLCCDWTVHPKLDRDSAQEIAGLFDQYEARYRREAVGVSQADIPELVEFCEHTRFREQFVDACELMGIPAHASTTDEWWRSFLTEFSDVVKDCPLEAKPGSTTYVTRVTASAIDPASFGAVNTQFAICWQWERKDIETPGVVMALF